MFGPLRRVAELGTAIVVATGAVLIAQQPPASDQTPTFRAGTDVVQVDVSVAR